MSRFDDLRDAEALHERELAEQAEQQQPAHFSELATSISMLEITVRQLLEEMRPARSLVEDLDLTSTANNIVRSNWQEAERYTEAIQVDNPYAVTVEVRGSRDGGGPVVMRVPPFSTRVLTVRVRDLSLRAVGVPAGATPATLIRFDRPMPNGVYPYGQATGGTTAIVGSSLDSIADDGTAPVKIAGTFHGAPSTLASGQRGELAVGQRHALWMQLMSPDSAVNSTYWSGGDSFSQGLGAYSVGASALLYRGDGSWDRERAPVVFKNVDALAITAGTPQSIWTPQSGKKFRLLGWALAMTVASTPIFKVAGSEILRGASAAAAQPTYTPPNFGNGFLAVNANDVLQLDLKVSATVDGFVCGTEE